MYHLIGLGGIGMSALARILLQQGHRVRGSDATDSHTLRALEREGAEVQIGHAKEAVAEGSCVVYSSALQGDNVELQQAKAMQLCVLHRSELLAKLMAPHTSLLVAGMHGKTTTTALLAAVLLEAGCDPSFAIGGLFGGVNGRAGQGPWFVAEADESDGSFLNLDGWGAIVTNLEPEHLDYWKSIERIEEGFRQFCARVRGPLFWCYDNAGLRKLAPRGTSYGFSEGAGVCLSGYRAHAQGIVFSYGSHREIALALHGRHNALNGAAVFGLALALGIAEEAIRRAFAAFSGVARRLEFKGETQGIRIYDDYAHHPTEIRAVLSALREKERERRIVAVFQPHRFTRFCSLWGDFLTSFEQADVVVVTDIYSSGEQPIEGVTAEAFCAALPRAQFIPRSQLAQALSLQTHDVVITLGAGDITRLAEPLLARSFSKVRVAVIAGGISPEHDISLMSARNIAQALDPELYDITSFTVAKDGKLSMLDELRLCDLCFPVFHGPYGEDGMFQGLLEALQIPYVGCDFRASALVMQKSWTKQIALCHGVPTAPFLELSKRDDPEPFLRDLEERYPVWIKAVHLGSSIGVARAANRMDAIRAIDNAFTVDDTLIAEKEIEGRLIEFAVLGNDCIRVAPPCEILNHGAFYGYDKKYGPNAIGVQIPADITPMQAEIGAHLATTIYRATGCQGLARVDFFLDKEGHFWLCEINPMPGFTDTSGYPKMWEAAGLSQRKLCDELIALALHRAKRKVVYG